MPERSPGRLCPTLEVARALARREARQEEGAEEAEEVAERPAPAEAPGSPEAQPARQSLPQDQPPSTVLDSSPGGSQTVDSRTIPHPESEAAREAVKRDSARVSDWLSSSRKRLRRKQPHTWLPLAAISPQTAPAQQARGSAEAREPEETQESQTPAVSAAPEPEVAQPLSERLTRSLRQNRSCSAATEHFLSPNICETQEE